MKSSRSLLLVVQRFALVAPVAIVVAPTKTSEAQQARQAEEQYVHQCPARLPRTGQRCTPDADSSTGQSTCNYMRQGYCTCLGTRTLARWQCHPLRRDSRVGPLPPPELA